MSAIKEIIKTIEDIAFQTNLLALNAAVEASGARLKTALLRSHAASRLAPEAVFRVYFP